MMRKIIKTKEDIQFLGSEILENDDSKKIKIQLEELYSDELLVIYHEVKKLLELHGVSKSELPCQIGDTVYFLNVRFDKDVKHPTHYIDSGKIDDITVHISDGSIFILIKDIGIKKLHIGAFLTKEEAEEKLNEKDSTENV